ncbi:MAG: tetratricopeptide repeat protein [Myxococcales bacterium]|nr:tetratricopeptide repeat protein [Myxococcales bacterium]
MRLRVHATMAFVVMIFATQGCKGGEPSTPPDAEVTSGGELPMQDDSVEKGGQSPAIASTDAATSPWGATRAEQCSRPERTPMSSKANRAFKRGLDAAQANDIASAQQHFQDTLKKDARAYPALYNLGVLADRSGDERKALDYYQRSLGVLPDYEPAARGITTIEIRRGDVQDAVASVEPIARDHRTNLEIQALYAEVLVEARRYDEAWMAARRALKCDERFVPALIALIKASRAQGRDELEDSILDQAMAIDANVAELHFLNGERLKDEPGRLRDALEAYLRAVQLRPDYAEARMALGIQLLAGGNYADALSHFQVAEKLVPTLPAVHVNLGDAYRASQRWTDAQQAYRRAIELETKLPEAHFGLGLLYLSAGGDFPGLDEVSALEKSVGEFKIYRSQMGPRLGRDDQSEEYLRDLDRMIQRAKRRIERDKERSARETERGAREEAGAE